MTKIYVGNLPFTATEPDVRELFAQHGTVESVALPTDRETGRPRGFGFVEMPQADAQRAMQALNGFNMGGTQLSGALNGGSVAMTGNVFQSVAYGNSATNAIQVSALSAGLNTASASITNMQINRAAVNSQITGVNVQANGVNSSGAAGVNISGNSVMSMAVGNRAVNTVSSR